MSELENVAESLISFNRNNCNHMLLFPCLIFTYEKENQGKLPFLDDLLIRDNFRIMTTIYRKSTSNDIYMNWNAFGPATWKRGTLKTLVERAYLVCSNNNFLEKELSHLEKVF